MQFNEILFSVCGAKDKQVFDDLSVIKKDLLTKDEKDSLADMVNGFDSTGVFPTLPMMKNKHGEYIPTCFSPTDMRVNLNAFLEARELQNMKNTLAQESSIATSPLDLREKISKAIENQTLSTARVLEKYTPQRVNYERSEKLSEGFKTNVPELDEMTNGFQPGLVATIAAWTSHGKALTMNTKYLTFDGFIYNKDVKINDKVIGSDGREVNVTGVFPQGIKKVYRFIFSDETVSESCENHLWQTSNDKERRRKTNTYKVRTTKEIVNSLYSYRGNKRLNYTIPISQPVQYKKSNLKIDPYLLGLYLAEGNTGSCITLQMFERFLVDKIKTRLPKEDMLSNPKDGSTFRIKRRKLNHKKSETLKSLISLGLWHKTAVDKFIPKLYLYSDVNDRLELLQGLCDGDGSVINDHGKSDRIEYGTISSELKEDFLFLVRSLGGIAKCYEVQGKYKKDDILIECKKVYRIVFRLNGLIPVSMPRKIERLRGGTPYHKFIKEVEYLGEQEVQCISVDSKDSLFLIDDFNLTHNSTFWNNCAYVNASQGKKIGIISLEIPKKMVYQILLCRHTFAYGKKIIEYQQLFQRKLSEKDKEYLFGEVEKDFMEKVGKNLVVLTNEDFPSFTKEGITSTYRQIEEVLGGLNFVYWDHVNLFNYLDVTRRMTGDHYIKLITDIGKSFVTYDGDMIGTGLAAQVNREGWKKAQKNDGRYNMLALSEFHEIERSSTYVVFLYMDNYMVNTNEMKVQMVKHRIGGIMEEPVTTSVVMGVSVIGSEYSSGASSNVMDGMLNDIMGEGIFGDDDSPFTF